ncbi:MAG: TRAP transporter small permease [Gammaproteobacteria bacterium]|jgi:C4-dicarboxylate transporter DctQ subunit|nr:TRAP transporter small permease [Gammaproteobacteria bacterium]MBU1491987.1 TRAP transporter small permease [Gammaproteobacteria bacterium]MBU2065800.1 TRAP transporter small permease [Gammaproteobacteria bacterium]MBU2140589.1 TRAP transporter small permease [Gammaproteobacteria bacterium]MBU2215882.1 TRAP transporter small permease [Gammaproteobacteria bacterium]
MNALRRAWEHFEEGFIAFLLAAMTLVTFLYVILNNFYTLFYAMGDYFESEALLAIGDHILDMAQAMTWSNALTKALFAWLIFFGLAYGVRTAGHIGVDALVKLASKPTQRIIGIIACLCCLGYAGLITVASFDWMSTMLTADIGAEDLGHYGIKQWHITLIVPFGYAMVFIRFLEILVRILRNQQTGLGLADEAADALKLNEHEERK